MADRPILFSAPMIRALLAGTKAQTRRALKPQPTLVSDDNLHWIGEDGKCHEVRWSVGDRLWVREAWRTESRAYDDLAPADMDADYPVIFEADADWPLNKSVGRLRHSIHMPRWASRITLAVIGVRVERLQDISARDCAAEGIDHLAFSGAPGSFDQWMVDQYSDLWDHINGAGSWDANPWVCVIEFRREIANAE